MTSIINGKYLHIRCVAHIINLIVKEGLKEKDESAVVDCIRGLVRFIRGSPSRYQSFYRCVESEGIKSKKSLSIDVPTR
ncbi:hypothetical protein PSY31_22930, partial [Shigella flexneri]|nr:hypothetical protein [Shigella flexneri]